MESTIDALLRRYGNDQTRPRLRRAFEHVSKGKDVHTCVFAFAEWLRGGCRGAFEVASSPPRRGETGTYTVVPSTLGWFFHYSCERYLKRACEDETTNRLQIVGQRREGTFEGALLERGFAWERRIEAILRENRFPSFWWKDCHHEPRTGGYHVIDVEAEAKAAVVCGYEGEQQRLSLNYLTSAPVGTVLCQARFRVPEALLAKWNLHARIRFSNFIPDLLFIEQDSAGRRMVVVVDAKASASMKLGHRIQASFYALVLSEWTYVCPRAGIWLMNVDTPQMFDVGRVARMLENFFRHQLWRILSETQDWHFNAVCASCPYVDDCRHDIEDVPFGLSGIPGISRGERKHLYQYMEQHLPFEVAESSDHVQSLSTALEIARDREHTPTERKYLQKLVGFTVKGSLVPRRNDLLLSTSPALDALMTRRMRVRGVPMLTLPRPGPGSVDALVCLSVMVDPQTTMPYAWSLGHRPFVARTISGLVTEVVPVEALRLPVYAEQVLAFRRRFCDALHAAMVMYRGRRVVFATLEKHEYDAVLQLLMELGDIEKARICLYAMTHCVKFVQMAGVQQDLSQRRDVEPAFVAVTEETCRAVCFPIRSYCTLTNILEHLLGAERDWSALDQENMFRDWNMSDFVDGAASDTAGWYTAPLQYCASDDPKPAQRLVYARIRHLVEARLVTADRLLEKLWTVVDDYCRHQCVHLMPKRAATLRIDNQSELQHLQLAQLDFFTRYENIHAYTEHQLERCRSVGTRFRKVLVGHVTSVRDKEITLECHFGDIAGVGPTDRYYWMLTSLDGAQNVGVAGHNEFAHFSSFHVNSHYCTGLNYAYGDIVRKREHVIDVRCDVARLGTAPGQTVVLQPRYTNVTLFRVAKRLADIDRAENDVFLNLMDNPLALARSRPLEVTPGEDPPMTTSQTAIFDKLCQRRLQVVWGPPGAGKTFFIAATIARLMTGYRNQQTPFRVMVIGFTRKCARNAARRIHKYVSRQCPVVVVETNLKPLAAGDACEVRQGCDFVAGTVLAVLSSEYRVRTARGEWTYAKKSVRHAQGDDIRNVRPQTVPKLGDWCVVGGTAYKAHAIAVALEKASKGRFDMLVVDEASQMPLHVLAMATRILNTETSRILVVGDHLQLPPIVHASWPEHGPQSSTLELLRRRTMEHPDAWGQLRENHRMSPPLARFARDVLGYHDYETCDVGGCHCRSGRAQELALRTLQPHNELAAIAWAALTPSKPLVMVCLRRASTELEARLVAQIIAMYSLASDSTGAFVVTPHHVQREACVNELGRVGVAENSVVVNTVEKMQGQEHDCVVACYGIESVGQELDFVFSRPRLNVALSRAKVKTILIVCPELFKPDPDIFKDTTRQEGYALFQAVRHWCEENRCVLNID